MKLQFEASGKLKILTEQELAAADQDSSIIVCDTGILEDGSPYWIYIAVKPSKYAEYAEKASRHETVVFAEYGTILKYGYEATVPEAVKEEMRREYGFDENFMPTFIEEFKKEQIAFLKQKEDNRINGIVAMLKKKQTGT